jgi:hypothetical protein
VGTTDWLATVIVGSVLKKEMVGIQLGSSDGEFEKIEGTGTFVVGLLFGTLVTGTEDDTVGVVGMRIIGTEG